MQYGTVVRVTMQDGTTRTGTLAGENTTGLLVIVLFDDNGQTEFVARKRVVAIA
jgi:hypothetical protein